MDLPKSALWLMFSLARMTSMDDAILSPRYPRICCGELTNKYPQLLIFTWVLSLFQMFSHALRTVLPPSQLPRFYPYSTMASNITLYTWPTPNGIKASITLEELGLPYKTEGIDISSSSNPQKQEYNSLHYAARCLTIYWLNPFNRWFLKINPNGRIPALLDGSQRVFESGAIMTYLVDKYDTDRKISYAPGTPEHVEQTSWLMFQMAGLGPMQGACR